MRMTTAQETRHTLNPWAPAIVGAGSFLFIWWMWGSLARTPVNHDEAAYVLQARIFSSGHLVAPARPLSLFFEQYHTFVDPVVAAKYPPGFSLLLVPGLWIGLVGIVPVLLAALSSALLFILARRFAGSVVALFSVVLAGTSDISLHFNPSYASETATEFLFLLGWWSLLGYHDSGHRRWLIVLSLAVGWGAITRPLTMLAYAIPTGVAALISIARHRHWRVIPYCLVTVGAVIGFMLVWDARVTGDRWGSPHAKYAQLYIPADRMGFSVTPATPARDLLPEYAAFRQWVDSLHRGHTPKNLPSIAANRAAGLVIQTWPWGRVGAVLGLLGFLFVPLPVGRIVWSTSLLVFGSHLLYAHALDWPAYYLELQAPLNFMAAAGAVGIASWLARAVARTRSGKERSLMASLLPSAFGNAKIVSGLFGFWLLALVPFEVVYHRRGLRADRAYVERFQSLIAALPNQPAVVFVRYATGHSFHNSLVQNDPDSAARIWIVHDLGEENGRLLSIAPDRRAYLYSETKSRNHVIGTISALPSPVAVP